MNEPVGTDTALGARVLLVEDSPTNQRVAVLMFRTLGCRVDVAVNGREAVEMLERASYDVVFMDCHMPVMDGYEATAAIHRAAQPGHRVPIIAMTATATERELQKCLDAGMDDFIGKPAKLEELAAVLRRWTGMRVTAAKSATEADTTNHAPTLDPKTFARILALCDTAGAEFVNELLETFLIDASDAITNMREALKDGQVRQVWSAAHTLKGSSAGLGAFEMAATCGELERLTAGPLVTGAGGLVDRLHDEFGRLREALEQQGAVVKF